MTQWNEPQGRRPENWEQNPTQYIPRDQRPPAQPPYHQSYQQGYGAPGQPQRPNPFGAESNEAFGIVGTVCALLGFIVILVGIAALNWGTRGLTFSDIHHALQQDPNATGFAKVYFGWLAWTFAIVGTLAAIGSCFPSPAVRGLRILAVVIGIAAAGLSFLALRLDPSGSYSDYIKHIREGFYVTVVGYLLLAIGGGIGTRKV